MKLLICGSRDWSDASLVEAFIWGMANIHPNLEIIHGGASGVDTFADDISTKLLLITHPYRISDTEWNEFGKAAGPIRNRRMFDHSQPDLVVAFLDPSSRGGSKGTKDMCAYALSKGCAVYVMSPLAE